MCVKDRNIQRNFPILKCCASHKCGEDSKCIKGNTIQIGISCSLMAHSWTRTLLARPWPIYCTWLWEQSCTNFFLLILRFSKNSLTFRILYVSILFPDLQFTNDIRNIGPYETPFKGLCKSKLRLCNIFLVTAQCTNTTVVEKCRSNAQCSNHICTCDPGYVKESVTGNKMRCVDIDECASGLINLILD